MADEIVPLPDAAPITDATLVAEPELEAVPDLTQRQSKAEWLRKYHFKKGQSGNPSGKKKNAPITAALKDFVDKPYPPLQRKQLEKMTGMRLRKDMTFAEAIALGQLLKAVGNTETAKAIMDRIDGAVTQALELSSPGGGPLLAPVIVTQYVSVNKDDGKVINVTEAPPSGDDKPNPDSGS